MWDTNRIAEDVFKRRDEEIKNRMQKRAKAKRMSVCVAAPATAIAFAVLASYNYNGAVDTTIQSSPDHIYASMVAEEMLVANNTSLKNDESSYTSTTPDHFHYQDIMNMQEKAVLANELLNSSFKPTDDLLYPDDYAGSQITDEGTLLIYLTDQSNIDHYKSIISEYLSIVEFKTAQLSLNTLLDSADRLAGELKDKLNIDGFGPDITNNCIIINIKDPEIPVLESLTLCKKEKKYAEYIYNYSRVIQVPVRFNYNNGSE